MAFLGNTPDDQGQNQNNLTPNPQGNQQPGMPPANPNIQPSAPQIGSGSVQTGAPAPQQKGSGRFTNLQKYVQANQGAGERTTAAVQRGIEKSLNPLQKQTAQAEQTGQQGIQQGQKTLLTGRGLERQMAAPDFTPDRAIEFANQNAAQVGQFRTGQGVDESALQQQNLAFQQANVNLGQKVDEKGQAVGNELGRIGLLKDVFGGQRRGTYTTGQSRLDNLLLQSNGQNIANLQTGIEGQRQNVRDLQAKAAAQGKSIEQVIADEAQLGKDIIQTTESNIGRFKTDLGGQVEGFNKDLEAGIKSGNTFIDFYNKAVTDDQFKQKYGITKKEYQFNKPLFEQFGLKEGQQTFNVFNNQDLNLGQVADIEGRRAQDWRDVANQQNVSQYDALARLRGLDQAQYELDKASDINRAGFKQKEGEASLQGRIDKAQKDFLADAQNRLIEGGTGWVEGVKGSGFVSLADYLKNPDYYTRAQVQTTAGGNANLDALRDFGMMALSPTMFGGATQRTFDNVENSIRNAAGPLGDLAASVPSLVSDFQQSLFGGREGNDTAKGIQYVTGRTIGGGIYGPQTREGFEGAATGQALQQFLNEQGFGNYLTQGGVQTGSSQLEDMAREFGYRTNVQGEGVQQGFYNPMFERRAIEQAASTGGPLTREQIAEMSRTGGTSAQQAARQALIDQNKYLTSDSEFNEILNRERGAAQNIMDQSAANRLTDLYRTTDQYRTNLDRAITEDILAGQSNLIGDLGINRARTQAEAAQMAQQYAQNNPEFSSSDIGRQYQDYLNQLSGQRDQTIAQNLQRQVYGRPTGTGDNQATVAQSSGPLTLEEVMKRMGRV